MMKIVILEDEPAAVERITQLLKEIDPLVNIIATHDTVASAQTWFSQNPVPDVVLSDIQLADGTAFDLFKQMRIDCPVIFTTAYNKYAIEAFQTMSVDYLLKPIKKANLETALQKLDNYKLIFNKADKVSAAMHQAVNYKKRFLVRFGDTIKTLPVEDISFFNSENRVTFAITGANKRYPMDLTLDALEKELDPVSFFRINRQFIISLKAISEMKLYSKARVIIKLNPEVKDVPVVSYERVSDFKLWLAGEL